ncbi:uncharacterized protein LOC144923721 isoform X1 [Branchiostoma floridae x Branchiostoma belcheri]
MISVLVIVRGFYHGAKEVQKLQRKRKTRVVGVAELGTDVPPRQTSSEIWRCAKFSDVDEESTQLRKTTSEPDCLDLVMPFEPFQNDKRDHFPRFPAEDNSNNPNHNNNRVRTVLDTSGCHSNGCHNNSCHGHHGHNNSCHGHHGHSNSCHGHHHGPARVINVRSAWTEEVVAARDRDVETTVVRSIPDNRVMITR